MRYRNTDIKQYIQAKEFVDTAIIPLIPFSFENEQQLQDISLQKDLIQVYIEYIERELKGRVFVLPEYYYLNHDKISEEKARINDMVNHIQQQPFNYIFLLTSDNKWRKITKDMDVELIWIPIMKEGEFNQEETQRFIQSQVKEIQSLIMDSWEN